MSFVAPFRNEILGLRCDPPELAAVGCSVVAVAAGLILSLDS